MDQPSNDNTENSEVVTFDASKMSMKEIAEEVKGPLVSTRFTLNSRIQMLRSTSISSFCGKSMRRSRTTKRIPMVGSLRGTPTKILMMHSAYASPLQHRSVSLTHSVQVEEVRTGKMMNHQRNPTAVARRKFEAELATYQSLQRKLAAVEARAKLDPSLAQLLASAKKSLAAEDAKWNDWAAKMKASEPASKAAHSKAPAKKPAAK